MSDELLEKVTLAMHHAMGSPRKDKFVPLSGFSREYQQCMRIQAQAAINAVRKYDKENHS